MYKAYEFQDLENQLEFFRCSLGRVDVYQASLPDDIKTELHALHDTLRELDQKLEERILAYPSGARDTEKTA